MQLKGSIIGSFRKYYNGVRDAITKFESANVEILSPLRSQVIDPSVNFVYLKHDNQELSPTEIQLIALHRILRSDFVYVYNPKGYIGLTTAYEIGRVIQRGIPLFFLMHPKDLPVYLYPERILSIEELCKYLSAMGKLPPISTDCNTSLAESLNRDLEQEYYHEP